MILYITEPGASLRVKDNHFIVYSPTDETEKHLPVKNVSSIVSYTFCHISSGATQKVLSEGIPFFYISTTGKALGKLLSVKDINVNRHRKQILLSEDSAFCLSFAKRVLSAKINNQRVFSMRLNRSEQSDICEKCIDSLKSYKEKATLSKSISETIGYEGMASRSYFQVLNEYLPPDFSLSKRTKNPPLDPTNALLSFAYTLLHAEIYTALEVEGLHPYFGFIHRIRKGHSALSSDIIEELRSVIADPLVVNFINYSGITKNDFFSYDEKPGVYLQRPFVREFIKEYEKKMQSKNQYTGSSLSYRKTIAHQVKNLALCIDNEDATMYAPLYMR